MAKDMLLPVIISVPHGGTDVPPEVARFCRLDQTAILLDGDTWSRELYALAGQVAHYVDTPIARVVVDLNRSLDDRPPGSLDGVVKTVSVTGEQVWHNAKGLSPKLVEQLLARYYQPYQQDIMTAVDSGRALLGIDCHTMLAVGPLGSADAGQPRPLICLSNRGEHTGETADEPVTAPVWLMTKLRNELIARFKPEIEQQKISTQAVTLNRPFRGGHLTRYFGRRGPLPWIQVEFSRALYLPPGRPCSLKPGPDSLQLLTAIRQKFIAALQAVLIQM